MCYIQIKLEKESISFGSSVIRKKKLFIRLKIDYYKRVPLLTIFLKSGPNIH